MHPYFQPQEVPRSSGTPPVWGWYVLLCVLMAACNGLFVGTGAWIAGNPELLQQSGSADRAYWESYGGFMIWMGVIFGVLNLAMPFLPKRPWAYLVHLGNILSACLMICPVVIAGPILVFWLREDVRRHFGMV